MRTGAFCARVGRWLRSVSRTGVAKLGTLSAKAATTRSTALASEPATRRARSKRRANSPGRSGRTESIAPRLSWQSRARGRLPTPGTPGPAGRQETSCGPVRTRGRRAETAGRIRLGGGTPPPTPSTTDGGACPPSRSWSNPSRRLNRARRSGRRRRATLKRFTRTGMVAFVVRVAGWRTPSRAAIFPRNRGASLTTSIVLNMTSA